MVRAGQASEKAVNGVGVRTHRGQTREREKDISNRTARTRLNSHLPALHIPLSFAVQKGRRNGDGGTSALVIEHAGRAASIRDGLFDARSIVDNEGGDFVCVCVYQVSMYTPSSTMQPCHAPCWLSSTIWRALSQPIQAPRQGRTARTPAQQQAWQHSIQHAHPPSIVMCGVWWCLRVQWSLDAGQLRNGRCVEEARTTLVLENEHGWGG